MATERAKLTAKILLDPSKKVSRRQAMIEAGYSESYASTGEIKTMKSWQELQEELYPDDLIAKTHAEAFGAVKVHSSITEPDKIVPDWKTRMEAVKEAHKVKGKYPVEKHDVTVSLVDKIVELTKKYED